MSALTEEAKEDFERKARRMIEWMNINCHPHAMIIVTQTSAELVYGEISIVTEDFLRD